MLLVGYRPRLDHFGFVGYESVRAPGRQIPFVGYLPRRLRSLGQARLPYIGNPYIKWHLPGSGSVPGSADFSRLHLIPRLPSASRLHLIARLRGSFPVPASFPVSRLRLISRFPAWMLRFASRFRLNSRLRVLSRLRLTARFPGYSLSPGSSPCHVQPQWLGGIVTGWGEVEGEKGGTGR